MFHSHQHSDALAAHEFHLEAEGVAEEAHSGHQGFADGHECQTSTKDLKSSQARNALCTQSKGVCLTDFAILFKTPITTDPRRSFNSIASPTYT